MIKASEMSQAGTLVTIHEFEFDQWLYSQATQGGNYYQVIFKIE